MNHRYVKTRKGIQASLMGIGKKIVAENFGDHSYLLVTMFESRFSRNSVEDCVGVLDFSKNLRYIL